MPVRLLCRPALALAVVALAGCRRGADPYVELVRERIGLQQEVVGVLRTVKDEPSMAAARVRLRPLARRSASLEGQMRELPPPSGEALGRLEREFLPQLREAQEACGEEVRRILALPGGQAFFEGLPQLAPDAAGSARGS